MLARISKPYRLSILAGILIGTSYIPFPPWAIFFCFVPLWIAWLEQKSWRTIFWTGWVAQFVLSFIGFNWVAYTVYEFGHLPWWLSLITLLLYCSFANLHLPLVGWTWFGVQKLFKFDRMAQALSLPIFLAIGERLFPMIFDWHFGYTWLWAGFPAFQLADMVGFVGLSTIGILLNGLLLLSWAWQQEKRARWWWPGATVPILFVLLNVWGHFHSQNLTQPDARLDVLLAQGNIGNQEKLAAEQGANFRNAVISRFANLTLKGLTEANGQRVDFAIWPETAFPDVIVDPHLNYGYPHLLKDFVLQNHVGLITGGFSQLFPSRLYTNSFFVIGPNGEWIAKPYHKTILLAFGEYLPGGNWFPTLKTWLPEVGDLGRGPGPTVLQAGDVKMGAQICYEGLFDWFTRKLANDGAQVLVNLTNDSWYGTWEQPYQHAYMTFARAIEVRRPLIRSTNTGISAVALASGEILAQSPLHEEWQHRYEVPYVIQPPPTVFQGWGFWFFPALLTLGLIFLIIRSLLIGR